MSGTGKSLRVLVAPLDWGLGHTARCVPLIGELVQRRCEVVLAADGASAQLLAREFPQLQLLKLPGYQIKYGKNFLIFSLFLQLPKIFGAIRKEQKWLHQLLKQEKFDIIISDNRPGFYSNKTHSIYITHQLRIQSGIHKRVDDWLQQLHQRYIMRFRTLWVPDVKTAPNAAGELSHPPYQSTNPVYLGLISRFQHKSVQTCKYDLMILLSGPEPQRSLLEEKLKRQLVQSSKNIIVVRGLPGSNAEVDFTSAVETYNHLSAHQLEQKMQESAFVICRSGYTTIMDLLKLKKKALLIPTPGQTEQEYLAKHMQQLGCFPFLHQQDFQLEKAVTIMNTFSYSNPFKEDDYEYYRDVIDSLLITPQLK